MVASVGTKAAKVSPKKPTVKNAFLPLNLTAVVPVRFFPLIVICVPTGALIGVKPVMTGCGKAVTVKTGPLVSVPLGVVTELVRWWHLSGPWRPTWRLKNPR